MTKGTLNELDQHLFAMLDRLDEEGMSAEDIEKEARRAEALVATSDRIIDNQKLRLSAALRLLIEGDQTHGLAPMAAQMPGDA